MVKMSLKNKGGTMKSLKDLNLRIKHELKVNESEETDSLNSEVDRDDTADGVIMRINNETKMNANIKNLEFEVYYSDLARTLTDDDRVPFTFTKKKAKAVFEIILEEIGFFSKMKGSGDEEDEEDEDLDLDLEDEDLG